MIIKMDKMEINQVGIVCNVGGSGAIRRRLFDMGITPSTKIHLRKRAPMGDPIEIGLRNYVLSLRKDEACLIDIELETSKEGNL